MCFNEVQVFVEHHRIKCFWTAEGNPGIVFMRHQALLPVASLFDSASRVCFQSALIIALASGARLSN